MSYSLHLPPVNVPPPSFSPLSDSPSLSTSPLSPSPASTSTDTPVSDGHSPLSLAAPAPAASVDPLLPPVPVSVAERVRSLIQGYSTALIASAVREKAWSDLQRLEEIFASPAEQAHLTKQQKWKLAMRQQRLQLYLQHEQGDQLPPHLHGLHPADVEEQPPHDAEDEHVEAEPRSSPLPQPAPSSLTSTPSLTIFTTPPLPPAHPASSLARELQSFSLYTPEGLSSTAASFTFSFPPRSPSAPAEAAYTIPTYDSSTSLHLSDSPSTPSSSSSHSSHSPRPTRAHSREELPPVLDDVAGEATVSRSGRRIKRTFDMAALGGNQAGQEGQRGQ